uniref:Uncharacterized protein n=1 Tax=Trichogramma kaykai TaxID=54128 RepID=A0ABD2XH89_9HYME
MQHSVTLAWKPLQDAALSGNLTLLESLLKGGNPDAVDELGRTALNFMCSLRKLKEIDLEVLQLLVQYGADVNRADKDDDSPLMVLFNSEYNESKDTAIRIEALKILLKNGADVKCVNHEGLTIFKKIILCDPTNPDTAVALELLLKNGADPNIKVDESGNTALNLICSQSKLTKVHLKMVRIFLQYKADVNTPDEEGNSPMMNLFCKESTDMGVRIEALRILLKNGADVTRVNHEGLTIFKKIIRCDPVKLDTAEALELILENGADPNMMVDELGNTALNFICNLPKLTRVHLKMIQILLKYKADVNIKDKCNFSPIMSLFLAAKDYELRLEVFKLLLENGADLTLVDQGGNTILHIIFYSNASKNPCIVETVELLLKGGVDVNIENKSGQSAFHVAVKDLKHPKVIELLSKKM